MSRPAGDAVSLNQSYLDWLRGQTPLIDADLKRKARKMAESPFVFLRGTFHLWISRWPDVCRELSDAPKVLAVGDLHVENFGTWRDAEGRLVFGINDFDDAYPLAYTNDLVRLACSAILAADDNKMGARHEDICSDIIEGYRKNLAGHGRPVVIAEQFRWMSALLRTHWRLRDPRTFWHDILDDIEKAETRHAKFPVKPSDDVIELSRTGTAHAENALPGGHTTARIGPRQAGVGSLGKVRTIAVAHWNGGLVAREAKRLTPSACIWAGVPDGADGLYSQVLEKSVRCPDPGTRLIDGWLVRRVAPDCDKVALQSAGQERVERKLLRLMGWEVANIHRASGSVPIEAVLKDLAGRPKEWLLKGARHMSEQVRIDWRDLNRKHD